MADRRRVLLVGWDAADWKVIHPLIDAGHMPHLARLLGRGVMGNMATLQPMLSPMLWTSIATGKRPHKHGVHGFAEVAPETGDVRPVSSLSRSTKAIWNILHQEGKTCHVVGWWPSHPAEPVHGAMVSNHFQVAHAPLGDAWPLTPGTVHPAAIQADLAALRIHPQEIEGDMLRAFVPRAPEIDPDKDPRLGMLARVVAECASVHAAATHILHTRPDWDFAAIYYDAIDHFSHGFMRYHPPRLEWVSQKDFDLYSQVLGGAYVYHDTMLGVLLELAGDETTVLLVSDHGFHPDHLRPRTLPNEPAGPAAEHRPFGIFVAAGPGIRQDELVHGASVLDVAPTVLTLFDLPIGRDMDGKPLTGIFAHPSETRFVDSWDDVSGEAALLDRQAEGGSAAAAAVLRQLADLGYIDALPENRQQAIDETIREERWNLARALVDAGLIEDAVGIVADLWQRWPDEGRFGVALMRWQLDLGEILEARETFRLIGERKQEAMHRAAADFEALAREIRAEQELSEAPAGAQMEGIDLQRLDEGRQRKLRRLQSRATLNPHAFAALESALLAAERRFPEALDAIDRAAGVQTSQRPALGLQRGEILLAMRRAADADREFSRVLEADPINPAAHLGRARAAIARGAYGRAAVDAQAAIGSQYMYPRAHLLAGFALWRGGRAQEAEAFLRTAVAQQPVFPAAHRVLASYLDRVKGDVVASWDHRRLAVESQKLIRQSRAGIRPIGKHLLEVRAGLGKLEPSLPHAPFAAKPQECVVVVSGLPRSGTSMMMQMIRAGGFPILTDDHRLADESNPKGYLEFEPAKRLTRDRSWIQSAVGKAVKIVAPLVQQLPRDDAAPPYIIVNMRRPIGEIVASQQAMLGRDGKTGAGIPDQALASVFERQVVASRTFLAHLESQGRARVIDIHYHDVIADPAAIASRLADIFNSGEGDALFDVAAATAVVDPTLRRFGTCASAPNKEFRA